MSVAPGSTARGAAFLVVGGRGRGQIGIGRLLIVCQAVVRSGVQGQLAGRCSQVLRWPRVIRLGASKIRNLSALTEALRRSPSAGRDDGRRLAYLTTDLLQRGHHPSVQALEALGLM